MRSAIRDQRLYRESYQTFEEYLRQRWDLVETPSLPADRCGQVDGDCVSNWRHRARERIPGTTAGRFATRAASKFGGKWLRRRPAGKVTAKHVQDTVKRVKV